MGSGSKLAAHEIGESEHVEPNVYAKQFPDDPEQEPQQPELVKHERVEGHPPDAGMKLAGHDWVLEVRAPQSTQSVPKGQELNSAPEPPSSHSPSEAVLPKKFEHVFEQVCPAVAMATRAIAAASIECGRLYNTRYRRSVVELTRVTDAPLVLRSVKFKFLFKDKSRTALRYLQVCNH